MDSLLYVAKVLYDFTFTHIASDDLLMVFFWQNKEYFYAKELEGEAHARASELAKQVGYIVLLINILSLIDIFSKLLLDRLKVLKRK